jgi:hypothetical protein
MTTTETQQPTDWRLVPVVDYSSSVCPACEAGYHEDPSQKLVFKCTCPCHG